MISPELNEKKRKGLFSKTFFFLTAFLLVLIGILFFDHVSVQAFFERILAIIRLQHIETVAPLTVVTEEKKGTEESSFPIINELLPNEGKDEKFITSSFTDIFSGSGWLNEASTTLYRDNTAQAFMWNPKFSWEKKDILLKNTFSSTTCINNDCATLSNSQFIFDGVRRVLPKEFEYDNVLLTLHGIGNRWILVGTVKKGSFFSTYAFSFDGQNFKPLCSDPLLFSSRYLGKVGVEGDTEDILLLYGGYEGKGMQIHEGSCIDVSRFFGIRLMDNGFAPLLLFTRENGLPQWYISSLDSENQVFLKAFSDAFSKQIIGTVDLGIFLRKDNTRSFTFSEIKNKGVLAGAIQFDDRTKETGYFSDEGFAPNTNGVIISKNLNTYPGSAVRKATIVSTDLFPGDTTPQFFLSNDNRDWISTFPGKEVIFSNENGEQLFWKVLLPLNSGGRVSPYFRRIRIDFKVSP